MISCAVICILMQIKPAVVVSGSMEPAIHTGSLIFIDKKKTEADIGEIIAFEKGGVFITHRIVGKTETGYITKGDANKANDMGILPKSSVVGTTEYSLPYLGYAVKRLAEPGWIIISVTICCCLMLASRIDCIK